MTKRTFLVGAAGALFVVAACVGNDPAGAQSGAEDAGPGAEGGTPDAGSADVAVDAPFPPACNLAAEFGTVTPFDSTNTDQDEASFRFAPDEQTAFLARGDLGSNVFDIYVTTRTSGFSTVTELAGVNTPGGCCNDTTPSMSADGLEMIFDTNAPPPVGTAGPHLWRATRSSTNQDFAARAPIDALVDLFAFAPYLAPDGSSVYFYSTEDTKVRRSVRISGGQFAPSEILTDGSSPVVTADERTMYFKRTGDIWRATRSSKTESWGNEIPMPGLSSSYEESPTWVSPDGCRIFLVSSRPRPNGQLGLDIYSAEKPK